MRPRFGDRARRRLRIAALSIAVLVCATVGGRELIAASNKTASPPAAQSSATKASAAGHPGAPSPSRSRGSVPESQVGGAAAGSPGATNQAAAPLPAASSSAHAGSSAASSPTGSDTATPVEPIGPDVVHTANVSLDVAKGSVGSQMSKIADLTDMDGGYVDSSSLSGGTSRSTPVTGNIVVRVPDSDFAQVLAQLDVFGKVRSQQESGQDVTGQVAENSATLEVLQDEVNLLQSKLSQATDINTFLQIEGQLAPVQQQLQQLQSQQNVLENTVALATVTVNLAAPGAPVPGPEPRAHTNAGRAAWRYATHNALVVLDGLTVAAGWALPLLVLGGLGWLVVTRLLRRRRPGVTPA